MKREMPFFSTRARLTKRAYRAFPGRFNRNSNERIVGKFFIRPDGEVCPVLDTHQEFAYGILQSRGEAGEPVVGNKIAAEDRLKSEGWIRGQIYEFDGLGLEGTSAALNARAANALRLLPHPRRIVLLLFPEGHATEILPTSAKTDPSVDEAAARLLAGCRGRRGPARLSRGRPAPERRGERLRLARRLLTEAARFARSAEGRWALEHFERWWLAGFGGLYLDKRGRLWWWPEKHWFHVPPDEAMDTAGRLAERVTAGSLRAAIAGARKRGEVFWREALAEERECRLGRRGRST